MGKVTLSAYTSPTGTYPGYLCIEWDGEQVIVTVREELCGVCTSFALPVRAAAEVFSEAQTQLIKGLLGESGYTSPVGKEVKS